MTSKRSSSEPAEPEHFQGAWSSYPGHETMRRDRALAEFRRLTPAKQKLCRAAVPGYASVLASRKKRPMDFQLWVKSRGFEDFPNAVLPEERKPPPSRRFVQGDELIGLGVASRIGERRELNIIEEYELGRGVWTIGEPQPDLVALAVFVGQDIEGWQFAEEGGPQFGAWRDRLKLWLRVDIEAERIWLEPFDPAIHALPAIDPRFKLRKAKRGLRIPAPWPPHRNGSWPSLENSELA